MSKLTGKVKWFDQKKGFGVISSNENEKEYFVHHSEIVTKTDNYKYLREKEEVEFELGTDKNKRECAKKVCGCNGAQLIFENPVYNKSNY